MNDIAEVVRGLIRGYGSAEAVAEQIGGGVTMRSVQRHAEGTRAPTDKLAAKYVALLERRRDRTSAETESVEHAPFDASRSTLDAVLNLAERCEALLTRAEGDPEASYRDRAGAIHALKGTLRDLAKLRGELEPTEASILRSPAWARLRESTLAILRAHPDAAKALLTTWQALEDGNQ